MRRVTLVLAAALVAVSPAIVRPQDPVAPVSTVVFATDPEGRPVTDLRPDELQVFEDDTPQRLASVHAAVDGRLRNLLAPDAATIDPAGRIVVVFIDDMNIPAAATPLLRMLLRQIRDEILAPDDLVAVVSTGNSSIAQDLGRDPTRARYNALTERVMGAGEARFAGARLVGATGAAIADRVNYSAIVALQTARDLVNTIGRRGPGLKAVVYLSSGYHVNPYASAGMAATPPAPTTGSVPGGTRTDTDVVSALSTLTADARRGTAAFYAIDPVAMSDGPDPAKSVTRADWQRYLQTSHIALRILSHATGGFCVCGDGDLTASLRRIGSESANYYVLAYQPSGQTPNQQKRRVRIATTRSGVILRYAPDYYPAPQ